MGDAASRPHSPWRNKAGSSRRHTVNKDGRDYERDWVDFFSFLDIFIYPGKSTININSKYNSKVQGSPVHCILCIPVCMCKCFHIYIIQGMVYKMYAMRIPGKANLQSCHTILGFKCSHILFSCLKKELQEPVIPVHWINCQGNKKRKAILLPLAFGPITFEHSLARPHFHWSQSKFKRCNEIVYRYCSYTLNLNC